MASPATTPVASTWDVRGYAHLTRFYDHTRLQAGKGGAPAWFKVLPAGPQILFWINPQTYQEQTQSLFQEAPTLTGVCRLIFGEQPVQINLEGTTGIAGYDAGDHGGMADLERLKPRAEAPDVQVEFHYPYMFSGGRFCFVQRFEQETRPDAPLYYYYKIDLICYDIVANESPGYVAIDPSAPSGRQTDCRYSSLNLPWTNPQHPPGFIFLPGGAAQEETEQALYPQGPCTPQQKKPVPIPTRAHLVQ